MIFRKRVIDTSELSTFCKAYCLSYRKVDGKEDDMVKSMAIASYGDEPMRRGGRLLGMHPSKG